MTQPPTNPDRAVNDARNARRDRDMREMRDVNAALITSSVRQQELTEQADRARDEAVSLAAAVRESKAELTRELARMARLQALSTRMARAGDLSTLLQEILAAAAELTGTDKGNIQFLVPETGNLRIAVHQGLGPRLVEHFAEQGWSASCDAALRQSRRVIVEDVTKEPSVQGTVELEIVLADGIRAIQCTPLIGRDGRFLGMLNNHFRQVHRPSESDLRHLDLLARMAADLIERAETEQALRESEQRYRALFESIDEGFCIIEFLDGPHGPLSDYVHVEANPAYTANAGIPDIVGRKVREMVPDEAGGWVEIYRKVLVTGEPVRFQRELVATGRFLELSAFRVEPAERRQVGVLFRDITRRRRTEQALRESEARYRTIVDQVRDYAIFSTDVGGRATTWNQGVRKVLGFEEADFIGQDIRQTIFTPEDIAAGVPEKELEEAARTGRAGNDRWMRRKDGERFFANGVTSAQRDDLGRLIGFTKVARDQTDRKRLEEELAAAADELSQLNRRKDEFLAMLSHELRNPLAPIRSAVHLLKAHSPEVTGVGSENLVQKQAREIIERQTGNLTKLVGDLLEVSRVVSGRIRMDFQVVDLSAAVRHALETVTPLIEHHKHELTLRSCDQPLWVNADAMRIEEVIINILNNAAKYTEAGGGGRIEVFCERVGGGDGRARIRVRDNGIGIDEKLLPRIFDLFTQADRTLDRAAGGLGIGLSLARRLVELHGGTIEAFSPPRGAAAGEDARPGEPEPAIQGSEFVVTLPITAVATPGGAQPSEPAAADARPGGGMRVLLVDDNIDLVMMVSTALRSKGHTVQSAYTGPEGLKAAEQWRPEVVLLDIGLPGLDGYELARRLRAHALPELRRARLIALTGYGRDADIDLAREAGFDGHLVKPYDIDQLGKLVASPSQAPTEPR